MQTLILFCIINELIVCNSSCSYLFLQFRLNPFCITLHRKHDNEGSVSSNFRERITNHEFVKMKWLTENKLSGLNDLSWKKKFGKQIDYFSTANLYFSRLAYINFGLTNRDINRLKKLIQSYWLTRYIVVMTWKITF